MVFVAVCWIPKATVQAALGPVALDYARDSPEMRENANILLIIAIMSIVITSPIGAFLIMYSGPKLLHKSTVEANEPTSIALATETLTN